MPHRTAPHNSLISTALAKGLEMVLNEANRLDEHQGDTFSAFRNQVLALQLTDLKQTLYLLFTEYGLSVQSTLQGHADAEIRTTLPALINLPNGRQLNPSEFSGDIRLAEQFVDTLGGIEIDWEEHLSHYTGDLVAFKIGHAVRTLEQRSEAAREQVGETLREYLQFEAQATPTQSQVERFNRQVAETEKRVDALEQRIDALLALHNSDSEHPKPNS